MILSKNIILEAIKSGDIIYKNGTPNAIKDQSIDVSLGRYIYLPATEEWIDLKQYPDGYEPPLNTMILAYTDEFIGSQAGSNILPSFKLKSSAARLGIFHSLAGHGEVGFHNRWAMEFFCMLPIKLKYTMMIGQIYFTRTEGAESEDYSKGGTYQSYSDIDKTIENWKKEDILPKPLKDKYNL